MHKAAGCFGDGAPGETVVLSSLPKLKHARVDGRALSWRMIYKLYDYRSSPRFLVKFSSMAALSCNSMCTCANPYRLKTLSPSDPRVRLGERAGPSSFFLSVRRKHDSCGRGWTSLSFSKLPEVFCISVGNEAKTQSPAFNEEFKTRTSADEVRKEILACYELVHKLGRGAVYLGSARTKVDHPHYIQAKELGREVALLLNCTSWTGIGPGLMDAVIRGAMQAEKPVAGFKISKEAGEWTSSNYHPYLPDHTYLTCRFFSARKHGLVDAGVRAEKDDKTAFVALPGGVGTLDEIFEVLTLMQLERIGTSEPVPFLVMNYDGFYTNLLLFLDTCGDWGTLSVGELEQLWKVFRTNGEALEYLADFYGIDESTRTFRQRLKPTT